MIWKAVVDCYYQGGRKPVRKTRHFLVAAPSSMDAFDEARKYAETTAKFGQKWIGFEVRSCGSASIPMEIPAGSLDA